MSNGHNRSIMENIQIIIIVLVITMVAMLAANQWTASRSHKASIESSEKIREATTEALDRMTTAIQDGDLLPVDTVDRFITYQGVEMRTHIKATSDEQTADIENLLDQQTDDIVDKLKDTKDKKRGF